MNFSQCSPALQERIRKQMAIDDAQKHKNKSGCCNGPGNPVIQESQAGSDKPADGQAIQLHRKKDKEAHDKIRTMYSLRFVFLVSDKHRRDGFGMAETVADCLIRAVRRFIESGS